MRLLSWIYRERNQGVVFIYVLGRIAGRRALGGITWNMLYEQKLGLRIARLW